MMAILAFFLSHYILPDQNGVLSLYSVFVALVLPFIILGMPASIMLQHNKLNDAEFKLFFTSSLVLSGISFLCILLIFIFSGHSIAAYLNIPFRLLLMGLLYAGFVLFQENITSYLRTFNRPIRFLWLSVIRDFIEIGLAVLLVIYWGKGAEGRVLGGLISGGIVFLYSLYFFYRNGLINNHFSKKYFSVEFKFGFSQIFFQLQVFVFMGADKYFINYYNPGNKSALGIYFMASLFAFIINVLVNAFFSAYQPQLYKLLNNISDENKYKLLRVKYLFAAFLLVATVVLCLVAPFVYRWFINKDYYSGVPYIAWNAFGFFFWGLSSLLLGILYYYKRHWQVICISLISAVTCITLNNILIKSYGIMGACYANLLTYIVFFVILISVVGKTIQLPWLAFGKIFNGHGKMN
jgi:O-antigen/teichoic acid export membrane protein